MKAKKLQLEVIDPVGNLVRQHHFFFDSGVGNKLHLDIDGHKFVLKYNGKLEYEITEDF